MRRVGVNALFVRPGIVGGTEQYVTRLLLGLAGRLPADLELMVYVSGALADAVPELRSAHRTVTFGDGDVAPLRRVLAEHTWLNRRARADGLSLMHHLGGTMPAVRSTPGVMTVHDVQPLVHPHTFRGLKRRYLQIALPRSARAAERVIAASEFTKAEIVRVLGIAVDRIDVVLSGIDPAPVTPSDDAVLDRLDLRGVPFFVFPAMTYGFKNHRRAIEAMPKVLERHPDAVLVLIGREADAEQAVTARIAELGLTGRVRRPGRVSDDDREVLYHHATALVFPSRYEGFGIPVIEAMARDLPVIASNVTAVPETVADAGVLVDPDDTDAWSTEMLRMIDDPSRRDELVRRGRERAAVLTWAHCADSQVESYQRALGSLR